MEMHFAGRGGGGLGTQFLYEKKHLRSILCRSVISPGMSAFHSLLMLAEEDLKQKQEDTAEACLKSVLRKLF